MNYAERFAEAISTAGGLDWKVEEIVSLIEIPKVMEYGDLAFPCFQLAKHKKTAPHLLAVELATSINSPLFEKAVATGGYVNVFLNKQKVAWDVLQTINIGNSMYGQSAFGAGKKVTIDLSSPNIAKPFSMGHLRSTVIGNSLSHILEKCSYSVSKINHLGDWGTQFGKLIAAYKLWGSEEAVKKAPIVELLALYVKFHQEAEKDHQLQDAGRAWFKKLEDGDREAIKLWKWFRAESLAEFNRIYEMMDISFDSTAGEAFYNDKMAEVVAYLEEKELLIESESAQVVLLENEGLPPCLIKKSDGATLYATRDLAAAIYRHKTYDSDIGLYVVGNEQSLHFKQLFAVLGKMGYSWSENLHHISFGMMLMDGKKMSTRKGTVILLEETLKKSIALAAANIEMKNPNLSEKEKTARQIGIGAVVFHDLKNDRRNDIEFSLEDMLRTDGETGPYVQYTNARALSLLRKIECVHSFPETAEKWPVDKAWSLIKSLMEFPEVIRRAAMNYDPSQVAKYVIQLAQSFNKYYAEVRILDENEGKPFRLTLVSSVSIVLTEGLRLLGIQAPKEM